MPSLAEPRLLGFADVDRIVTVRYTSPPARRRILPRLSAVLIRVIFLRWAACLGLLVALSFALRKRSAASASVTCILC